MARTWLVPEDLDLAEALERALPGDIIELHGTYVGPKLHIRRAVELRGGTICSTDKAALRLSADAVLRGVKVENPQGHGVLVCAGAPELEDVDIEVAGTGLVFAEDSAPRLYRCRVLHARVGLDVRDRAQPVGESLRVTATGAGLMFRGQSGGTLAQVAVFSGELAAVEVADEAHPNLVSVGVQGSGQAGYFIHGRASPALVSCTVTRSGLDALEVRGEAHPTVDGFRATEVYRGGLLLAEHAGGTYLEVEVRGCGGPAMTVRDHAHAELERGVLCGSTGAGLRVCGEARLEALELRAAENLRGGLDVRGQATVVLEDSELRGNLGFGLSAAGNAHIEARRCAVVGNQGAGVLLVGQAHAALRGGRVQQNAEPWHLEDQARLDTDEVLT